MEKLKKQKYKIEKNGGITLIALVITIIVILILAAISITMLTGDNSILKRAVEAKERTERAEIIESAKTDVLAKIAENKGENITKGQLVTILNKQFKTVDENSIPDDISINDMKLTTENERYTINLSEIYNGAFYEKIDLSINTTWQDKVNYNLDEENKIITLVSKNTETAEHKGDYSGDITIKAKAIIDGNEYTTKFPNSSGALFSSAPMNSIKFEKGIDTTNVTVIASMFLNCTNLENVDLSNFNTENVTLMSSLFANCTNLTSVDLSVIDTKNVITMAGMFGNCSSLRNVNLTNVETRKVNSMNGMFQGCTALNNLDLRSFNTSSVTDMGSMFANSTNIETIYVSNNFVISNLSNSGKIALFNNCPKLIGEKGTNYQDMFELDENNYRNAKYAHIDGGTSNPGYFSTK